MVFNLALDFSGDCCDQLSSSNTEKCRRLAKQADPVVAVAAVVLAILHLTGTLAFLPPAANYIMLGASGFYILTLISPIVHNACIAS